MTPSVGVAITSIPPRRSMLLEAIESVLLQSRAIDQLSVEVDARRSGASATRNRAWRALDTDWVCFLDDDDLLYRQHVDHLLRHAVETDADIVYPWFDIDISMRPGWSGVTDGNEFMHIGDEPAEGHDFDDDARLTLTEKANFIPITVLVRRELLDTVGGFPTPGSEAWPHEANEDWGCWRAMLAAGAQFSHLPERTWVWRWHQRHTMGVPARW